MGKKFHFDKASMKTETSDPNLITERPFHSLASDSAQFKPTFPSSTHTLKGPGGPLCTEPANDNGTLQGNDCQSHKYITMKTKWTLLLFP